MSYFLADANGYIDDFGSGAQVERFSIWANTQELIIKSFSDNGQTEQPLILAQALARAPKPFNKVVWAMREELIEKCKQATGTLVISDGCVDTLNLKTMVGNGSNQYKSVGTKAEQKTAIQKLVRLPALSNDPNFKATPIKQATDKEVQDVESREIVTAKADPAYDPSAHDLHSTQDFVELDKVAQLIREGNTDKTPSGTVLDALVNGGHSHDVGEPVLIARVGSKDYIVDGHHRLSAALLSGQKIPVVIATGRKRSY
jgi:hypothetical protein